MKMSMERWWNDADRGKTKVLGEKLSKCHFVHLASNSNLCDERPVTNRLKHSAA